MHGATINIKKQYVLPLKGSYSIITIKLGWPVARNNAITFRLLFNIEQAKKAQRKVEV